MVANPFIPEQLIGRQAELQQVCQILAADGDLLLAGVPGSGRRTLLRFAAAAVGSRIVEIDCFRATDSDRFLQLLAEGILTTFQSPAELALIQRWSRDRPMFLEPRASGRPRLTWHAPAAKDTWSEFQSLLTLPQALAEWLNCRVITVFLNFPHIRSWDRSGKWQDYLRQEIQRQSRVSYALIATVAERWVQHSNLQVVFLPPLQAADLQAWAKAAMATVGLQFDPDTEALALFLSYVQGHLGDAIALARRIWLDHQALGSTRQDAAIAGVAVAASSGTVKLPLTPYALVQPHHVHRSALTLVEDLSLTYESLILLLPPSQVRVLESLALDPTTSPHSREYIQKHKLSRGGGLQGALASLEQKGLVYGAEYGYRITMPMLAFWLKQRLS
jgi:hypothetical protein